MCVVPRVLHCCVALHIVQNLFQNNQVTSTSDTRGGGALYASGRCNVRLTGRSSFIANSATTTGGAISVNSGGDSNAGTLGVAGPLCAQNNRAGLQGSVIANAAGFLQVNRPGSTNDRARVRFSSPESTYINGNTPNDVFFRETSVASSGIFCGNTSTTSWKAGAYIISGLACACNSTFTDGSKTTCDSCTLGWDGNTCSCKVSRLRTTHHYTTLHAWLVTMLLLCVFGFRLRCQVVSKCSCSGSAGAARR